MTGYRFILLLPLMLCCLTGCSTLALEGLMHGTPLPEGFTATKVTKADTDAPFAVNRTGIFAALYKGELQLIEQQKDPLKAQKEPWQEPRKIAEGTATALSFSPNGERLAAALVAENRSIVRLFDLQGKVVGETIIPERVTSLVWRSEGELLIAALRIQKYSFGTELTSRLYRWDGIKAPAGTTLNDVTVRPKLAKTPDEALYRSLNIALSPYGDEIAYSCIKDPPVFIPYLRIAVRHLEVDAEHEVVATSVGSGAPMFTLDGESLLVGDNQSITRRVSVRDGKETYAWPSAGSYPALSPSGSYLFLDGRVYQDGGLVVAFPWQSRGAFLSDGSGLALSYAGNIYLVSGLNDKGAPPLPADLERLLKLRKLRSQGLISEKEYKAQKAKVTR